MHLGELARLLSIMQEIHKHNDGYFIFFFFLLMLQVFTDYKLFAGYGGLFPVHANSQTVQCAGVQVCCL